MFKKIFLLICVLMFVFQLNSLPIVLAEVLPTNLTASEFKYIVIKDGINIQYINEYTYDVRVNGYFLGSYHKEDKIFYPANSSIEIEFSSPISTEISENLVTTVIKPTLLLFLGFVFTWGIAIVILIIVLNKFYKLLKSR